MDQRLVLSVLLCRTHRALYCPLLNQHAMSIDCASVLFLRCLCTLCTVQTQGALYRPILDWDATYIDSAILLDIVGGAGPGSEQRLALESLYLLPYVKVRASHILSFFKWVAAHAAYSTLSAA